MLRFPARTQSPKTLWASVKNTTQKIHTRMKKTEILLQKIFENQEKLIGIEWAESRKKAFSSVIKMRNRQDSLTKEQARKEAFEQAEKIKNERIKSGKKQEN